MSLLNGRLPLSELVVVSWQPNRTLRRDAAASIERLNRTHRVAFGRNLYLTDAYRDYDRQVAYWLNPPTNFAARPGTSTHGWGQAVDIGSTGGFYGARYAWLASHGRRFGWHQPTVYTRLGRFPEPWHWEYDPRLDAMAVSQPISTPGTVPDAPGVTLPDPISPTEDALTPELKAYLDERFRVLAALVNGKVDFYYFTIAGDDSGKLYEARVQKGTYAHVPSELILAKRRAVLGHAGYKPAMWPPVVDVETFGDEEPWDDGVLTRD